MHCFYNKKTKKLKIISTIILWAFFIQREIMSASKQMAIVR
jgi:hypothetical protein